MPTIIVKATEPPEGDLTAPGDDYSESPLIGAIRKALFQRGISLDVAQHLPVPTTFPPVFIVVATTSTGISAGNFKDSLNNVWSGTTGKDGTAVPPAEIIVEETEE
ncbi:uncharacterized protein APUU_21917S [Aspergillus puulaauensis]|uniref:Uncharacterized protein n=1 Tax=Aspergillus puulaauensis TaxID=1220207 RepID=A0A7R7XHF6_9EURO|nr:uncharacterized protein APUU_21917S [Aspergillus puulaauensis]BCS21485.1 hypothetical protein APUU_21917S [Aspergillus puulaauensis]